MARPRDFQPRARLRDIVSQEVAGEMLLYVEETHQALCLNTSAALIYALCDGERTVEQIAADANLDSAGVEHALVHFAEAGLLETPPGRSISMDPARRRVLLGLGAAAIPIILMVTAPEARASASTCTGPGTTCSPLTPETCCSGECNVGICG